MSELFRPSTSLSVEHSYVALLQPSRKRCLNGCSTDLSAASVGGCYVDMGVAVDDLAGLRIAKEAFVFSLFTCVFDRKLETASYLFFYLMVCLHTCHDNGFTDNWPTDHWFTDNWFTIKWVVHGCTIDERNT